MTMEKFSFDEGDVLTAEVQQSEFPPVRYRGRVWVCVCPRKSIATEAEEKIQTERLHSNVHTFDAMPCLGTSIDDFDVALIRKEFLPKAVAKDILDEDERDITDQLASLDLYDLHYNCPTHIAPALSDVAQKYEIGRIFGFYRGCKPNHRQYQQFDKCPKKKNEQRRYPRPKRRRIATK